MVSVLLKQAALTFGKGLQILVMLLEKSLFYNSCVYKEMVFRLEKALQRMMPEKKH